MLNSIVTEWASLIFRWLHVIAAIGWIGSSFYFIHLDLSLKKREGLPEGVSGDAWQVHGGGFYNIVKYLVAPKQMPDELTWFYWEAYATWLSGFALVIVVYYLDADLFLVDKSVLDLTPLQAGAVQPGKPRACVVTLRGRVPHRLRQARTRLRDHRLCVPGRPHLRLHPCAERPRRLQPDRRHHRHHHGGQRVPQHHSQPAQDRRGADRRREARSGATASRASSARCTTTT